MNHVHFCLQCDEKEVYSEMEFKRKDLVESVTGKSVIVPAVLGWHCPVCGECEFADGEGARYSNALENLRLSQKEAKSIKK